MVNSAKSVCILGATGRIGIELTANLLKSGITVHAVVRNKTKLLKMLEERKIFIDQAFIFEIDLFDERLEYHHLSNALNGCSVIFNTATPKLSWVPFSKANRKWGTPVSTLTYSLVAYAIQSSSNPHIFVFCGPDYFKQYDIHVKLSFKVLSSVSRFLYPALQDNYLEAVHMIDCKYPKWSVLRCGSIRPCCGEVGNANNVNISFEKDGSNYQAGKGYSLIAADLGAYITKLIISADIQKLEKKMPFVFNIQF